MSEYYLIYRQDMVSVADTIRTKGETQAELTFPNGFKSAINAISTGIPASLLDDNGTRTSFQSLFSGCKNLTEAPMLDTKNATIFSQMFGYCSNLVTVPNYDYSRGMSTVLMFDGCTSLVIIDKIELGGVQSSGQSRGMFRNCVNLTTINSIDFSPIVFTGQDEFKNCPKLTNITFKGTIGNNFSFSDSPLLTTASLISIANALTRHYTLKLHPTSKTNCDNILGYNNDGKFELSGSGTQMSLTDFILNVKGWSITQ